MRVAALYDVHGNLPALAAVLDEVDREAPDLVVVGGDVALGPMPREALERVLALGDLALVLRGNADRAVVEAASGAGEDPWAARAEWAASRLDPARLELLASLPLTATAEVDGLGRVLFCHATPRSDEEIFTAVTPVELVAPMLAGVEARVVVCGHTHSQFDRVVAETRVVNAGSVGLPYEDRPGAYWALLGPGVELRRTEYDLEAAGAAIRRTGFPGVDDLLRENVLTPPGRTEAIEHFERLAREAAEAG